MQAFWQDLRYGFRMLGRNPGFALVAVLTLAIGIGATTAIFSVIDTLILRPLPQKDPDQLVFFRLIDKQQAQVSPRVFSVTVNEIIKQNTLFSEICYFQAGWAMQWENQGFLQEVNGARVSPNFFEFWSKAPLLGRGFLADEGTPGAGPVIVLSHRFWQTHYEGKESIIGTAIRFDSELYTVVGIMPKHFHFPEENCDFWIPSVGFHNDMTSYGVAARLRPEVSRAQVKAVLGTVLLGHLDTVPQYYQKRYNLDIDVAPLQSLFIRSMGDEEYDFLERTLITVSGAVILVLLICCVNTTILLLSRMEARQKEVAVRAALGAGRARLVRQFLTESSLLAVLGGLAGAGLSWWLLRILVASIPWYIPRIKPIELNRYMLPFTLLVSLLVGLIIGLAPVWRIWRGRLEQTLREGTAGAGGSATTGWFCSSLVAGEVALAMVLLVAAGLMVRSVFSMLDLDPGFEPNGLLQVSLRLPTTRPYNSRQTTGRAERLLERMAATPGIQSAGMRLQELGLDNASSEDDRILPRYVSIHGVSVASRDTLRTMGVRLLAGRCLDHSDAHPNGRAVLVNERVARYFWPGQNAVGQKLIFGERDKRIVLDVVGVVSDTRGSLWALWYPAAFATVYRPYQAIERVDDWAVFMLRTRETPAEVIPTVRAELKRTGMALSHVEFGVAARDLYNSIAIPRLIMAYVSALAMVGLGLAAIGIYGVLSYSVVRRIPEIGIRAALGARRTDVLTLVIRKGLILIVVGLIFGTAGALILTRVMSSLLYGVTPTDPVTFVAVSLSLMMVGLIACYIPARRATTIDPMSALRFG